MPVEILTKDDLQLFKKELLEDLKILLAVKPEAKQWLKSVDVRKMLGISAGTLQTLRINRTLPFTKVGGTIYYRSEDVDQVLKNNRISE